VLCIVDSDLLVASAAVFIMLGLGLILVGVPNGTPVDGGDSEPVYSVDGSIVVAGTSDGAEIKGNSFTYTTTESPWSFSFIGPNSDLAWTGAEDVDVSIKMIDQETGEVVDRYRETIDELPATEQETVDFGFNRKPAGSYRMVFDINFECTFITYGCNNVDSFETVVEVPK